MLPAPTLNEVKLHPNKYPDALCCILFAPLFSKIGKEGVIPRVGYLNSRSAKDIHFYCAGYGGYWRREQFPDMEVVGDVRYEGGVSIPWAFSQTVFSNFVDELEKATTWRYGGDTEMIVMSPTLSGEDCVILKIDQMIKDDAIGRSSEIFEKLIQFARSDLAQSAYRYSDDNAPHLFGGAVLGAFLEGPKALGKAWKSGRHYATRSIKKK